MKTTPKRIIVGISGASGIIYGITMGADGTSRLLSIKFDEAADYAKA